MLATFASIALLALPTFALNTGVAKLPVLGYNTWNYYACNINEDVLLKTAQAMADLGLIAAGYKHLNIDDCWALKNRTADGKQVPDPAKFPSGFNNLTARAKGLGLKMGIYGDSGWETCAGYPGSWSHELVDAESFVAWGFDCYIPYDNVTRQNTPGKYGPMRDAIAKVAKKTGVTMIYSLCEWGWVQPWVWAKDFGQSWRTTGDIAPHWDALAAIINANSFITGYTDFYGRNDLDMLQIGNGNLTSEEIKSHFTAWALMKSPLLIGTNLSALSPDTLKVLKNTEILAINQDSVFSQSIVPVRWGINPDWTYNNTHAAEYWSGPSSKGTVFMVLNSQAVPAVMAFALTESPWLRAGIQYHAHDLWTGEDTTLVRNWNATVPAHGVVALLLNEAGNEPAGLSPPCATYGGNNCAAKPV